MPLFPVWVGWHVLGAGRTQMMYATRVPCCWAFAKGKLAQFGGRGGKATRSGRGGARGRVAPKYRNPENPAETWAGRA